MEKIELYIEEGQTEDVTIYLGDPSAPIEYPILSEYIESTYSVNASELVLSTIKPDKNIWQEIEKSLLQEKIRRLETELAQVKLLSHPA